VNCVYRETPIAKAKRIGIGKLNNSTKRRECSTACGGVIAVVTDESMHFR